MVSLTVRFASKDYRDWLDCNALRLDRAPKGAQRDWRLVAPPRRVQQSRVKRLLRLNALTNHFSPITLHVMIAYEHA
jgi:hypothetical protein